MRRNDPGAWVSFDARFRPVLEASAKRANIPRWEWSTCVTELLADEALRLTERDVELPRCLDAYLIRASRNKYLHTKRASSCRDRNYVAASEQHLGEWFIPTTCSEAARRASAGPGASRVETSSALQRFADDLQATLTDEERCLLVWVSEGVSRRAIAGWLGVAHEACAKRIWRLCRRLRSKAITKSKGYPVRDRREIDRFLRRARVNTRPSATRPSVTRASSASRFGA